DASMYDWHTIRIAVNGDLSTIYMDENPVPVISGVSTSSTTSKYIKVGDGSGEVIGGYMDWLILDTSGAFAPGQGLPIPDGLIVDVASDTTPEPELPKWLVYDAGVLPAQTGSGGDSLDLTNLSQDAPGEGFVEEIVDDPDIAGNKVLQYLQPNGTKMYVYKFADDYNDSSLTLVARIKGERDEIYQRPFDLQWRMANANSREELRIWPADSTVELEKANITVKVDMDLYDWHTYHIAVSGDTATVYIDQIDEPIVSGVSTASNSDNYIKVGDGSGDAIGGYLDWMIVDMSGAFAPGEGLPIPDGLYVDKYIPPVVPKWLIYDASILPTETTSDDDMLNISSLSQDSPGADFVEEIIDDPAITGNKVLKYLQPTAGSTRMYRYLFDDSYAGTDFTLIARVRGEDDPLFDRAFDFQWRHANAGKREEFRIYTLLSKFKLEKAAIEIPTELDLYGWHTYRMAVYGDSTAVFIDENPEPIITGVAKESTTERYIKIGDGSSASTGGYLDWCILDLSGAYAPGEGLAIPEGLFVDPYIIDALALAASAVPDRYALGQNYPNPFNPTTKITFQLPTVGHVEISVFDVTGRLVATLVDEAMQIGYHSIDFDARKYASGMYFYRIKAGEFTQVKKMMLLK
ncbi:T9SS type A sorting domain-containing protein, partial [candidate division KSB1 bacterium]|nr:T9SS type A sorting domain-containing protein [candidate division KSB1 bacterium]